MAREIKTPPKSATSAKLGATAHEAGAVVGAGEDGGLEEGDGLGELEDAGAGAGASVIFPGNGAIQNSGKVVLGGGGTAVMYDIGA